MGGTDGIASPPGRAQLQQAKRSRRRIIDLCLFLLATTMLVSAAATTYFIMLSTPDSSESHPGGQPLKGAGHSRFDFKWLQDKFCEKFSNMTALQRFLVHSHQSTDIEEETIPVHSVSQRGAGGGAAGDVAGCRCDCPKLAVLGAAACVACQGCDQTAASQQAGGLRGNAENLALSALAAQLESRFTDMTCYLHGDETEMCKYEHAICYDGASVVLTVPVAPAASKQDPNGLGEVLGDPTGACYDYRYYEPTALEYTNCKYDLYKFARVPIKSLQPYPSVPIPPRAKGASASGSMSPSVKPSVSPARLLVHPASDWALPLNHRRWGPLNRGAVRFREMTDAAIFGPRPRGLEMAADGSILLRDAQSAAKDVMNGATTDFKARFHKAFDKSKDRMYANLTAAGIAISSVTKAPGSNYTVYWTDGALWFSAMDAQFDRHIYHATTRLMGLYHAQRQNRSAFGDVDGDGFLPPLDARNHPIENNQNRWLHHALTLGDVATLDGARMSTAVTKYGSGARDIMRVVRGNRVQYQTSSGWKLPPQDYVIITGPSSNFAGTDTMITFLRGVADLVSQPQTKFFTHVGLPMLTPNSSALLCSKRGAITGTHPRLFVNKADAWMFRKYAYDLAGAAALGLIPHAHHPPRKITVLLRKNKSGRNFENLDDVIKVIDSTGLPVEYIEDMGRLTFKQQILKMAGTGILVAAHGAALVNAMFLPQHAVVIEIFPWMFKKMTYSNLASLLSLWYLPVYTGRPSLTDTSYYGIRMAWQNSSTGQNFIDGCANANVSSVDALLHFRCNAVSKALPILVNPDRLREALNEGIDIIAAYSAYNSEWAPQLALLKGSRAPSPKASPSASKQPKSSAAAGTHSKAASSTAATGKKTATATHATTGTHTRSRPAVASKSASHGAPAARALDATAHNATGTKTGLHSASHSKRVIASLTPTATRKAGAAAAATAGAKATGGASSGATASKKATATAVGTKTRTAAATTRATTKAATATGGSSHSVSHSRSRSATHSRSRSASPSLAPPVEAEAAEAETEPVPEEEAVALGDGAADAAGGGGGEEVEGLLGAAAEGGVEGEAVDA